MGSIFFASAFYIWTNIKGETPDNPVDTNTPVFQDLEVDFTDFFEIRKTNTFDAVALISNPNTTHGASSISYEFIFENALGSQIGSKSGKAYILPGGSRYIVEPALSFAEKPFRVLFRVKEVQWESLSDYSLGGLEFIDTQFIRDVNNKFMRFSGVVRNRSPYSLQDLEVHVVLNDRLLSKAIAAGRTDMQTLLRDESRFFQIEWPYALEFEPGLDFRVETNLFENSNFIREPEDRELFQLFYDTEVESRP